MMMMPSRLLIDGSRFFTVDKKKRVFPKGSIVYTYITPAKITIRRYFSNYIYLFPVMKNIFSGHYYSSSRPQQSFHPSHKIGCAKLDYYSCINISIGCSHDN